MATLLSTQDTTSKKLNLQERPKIVFADVDGTLFSPNLTLLKAPFQNRKTSQYLKQHHIPFIVATGRSDWSEIDKRHIALLGLPQPNSVITANGTVIYHQLTNKLYSRDMEWESIMQYSKVKWADEKIESWNKSEITSVLKDYFLTQPYKPLFGIGNTFLIRIKFLHLPYRDLEQIRKDILSLFPSGIRVLYTEKLLRKNTTEIFSGEILITPKWGGKDNAVKYLLEKYAKDTKKILHAFLFGDASVDIPMLTMKDNPKYYTLSQFLVHPTPLAKKTALLAQKENTHLFIFSKSGPETIVGVLHGTAYVTEHADKLSDFEAPAPINNVETITNKQHLSPAQNNPIRKVVRTFEPLLDNIVDKNLSPNEVSFLGLTKLSEGLEKLYKSNSSPKEKLQGLYYYSFGNLTDVLDGVRARNSEKKEENGQLVDGFSDRAKEFMQLFIRAKKRLVILSKVEKSHSKNSHLKLDSESKQNTVQTFLTALSCTLPSIARAQAEVLGKVVKERDEKGGSMIDRTKKLSVSLLMDTIGAHKKSEAIDQQIYSANIATFQNRLSVITRSTERNLPRHPQLISESLSDFQKKALERWLLYIDVLQQEDTLIKKYLSKYPEFLKEYEKESQKLAKDYLTLKVNSLRKRWEITDYKLQIKKYLLH